VQGREVLIGNDLTGHVLATTCECVCWWAARETALRAAVGRAIPPIGYRIEIASNERTARQLIGRHRFAAAVIAPDSFAAYELALLHEVQRVVGKLVGLAEDVNAARRLGGWPCGYSGGSVVAARAGDARRNS
jgi:hypothetical protein